MSVNTNVHWDSLSDLCLYRVVKWLILMTHREKNPMIRLTFVAVALALASSAQAMPPIPLQQPDEIVIQVREDCGPGMRRTENGNCIRTAARRRAGRCARGISC